MKKTSANDIVLHLNMKCNSVIRVMIPEDQAIHAVVSFHKDANDIKFLLDNNKWYSYTQLFYYMPQHDGAITAVRIWLEDGYKPMAELAMAFGGSVIIEWDRCDLRELFEAGINAYTIFYDTRSILPFREHVKKHNPEDFAFPEFNKEV